MSFPPPPTPRSVMVRVTMPPLQLSLGAVVVASGWGAGSAVAPLRAKWRAAKLPATTWREVNLKTQPGPPWRSR